MATKETALGRKTWTLDPAHSQVEFAVRHMMFTKVRGSFRDVSGSIVADPDNPQNASVEVKIGAASIDTGVEKRDDHLRSEDFLDVENHPEITFRSTRVEGDIDEAGDRFRLIGDLAIRGESREVELDATFEGAGTDPWGNQRAGFTATTTVDRREWGITWNQALETGGILVGNDMDIELGVQVVEESEGE